MVSDWQGGDISKLFPALSGKEDLSMGEDKKASVCPDYLRGYSEEDCRGRHLRQ